MAAENPLWGEERMHDDLSRHLLAEQRLPLQRVILTNDDGIDAPRLRILEEVAAALASEV